MFLSPRGLLGLYDIYMKGTNHYNVFGMTREVNV